MYDLYKKENKYGIFLLIFSGIILFLNIKAILPRLITKTCKKEDYLVLLFFLLITALFVKLGTGFLFNYKSIDNLRKSDPELVKCYENDFNLSQKVCEGIWIGNKFFFFKAYGDFTVCSFNEIDHLRLYRYTYKGGSNYYLEVTKDGKKFSALIIRGFTKKAFALDLANKIAAIANVPLENSISID